MNKLKNTDERQTDFSGIKLKQIMEEKGYSQRFLAEKTNIGQSNLSYYLRGITTPSKKTVRVLANELCVDIEDLLNNPELVQQQQQGDYDDILEIAKQLGAVRFQLIQLIQGLEGDETDYNGQDQDFLHKIENIEDLTEAEALSIIKEEQAKRKKRRSVKTRKHLIQLLLNGFLIKNPYAYMQKVIEKSKNWTYIPRVAEELKKEDWLYDLKKENELKEKYRREDN